MSRNPVNKHWNWWSLAAQRIKQVTAKNALSIITSTSLRGPLMKLAQQLT